MMMAVLNDSACHSCDRNGGDDDGLDDDANRDGASGGGAAADSGIEHRGVHVCVRLLMCVHVCALPHSPKCAMPICHPMLLAMLCSVGERCRNCRAESRGLNHQSCAPSHLLLPPRPLPGSPRQQSSK